MKTAWCNPGFTASADYLQSMCELAMECNGSILECGSGISTVLCGLLARRKKVEVFSFEHRIESYDFLRPMLVEFGLTNVRLFHSPLTDYGNFEWYESPDAVPRDLDLVVCDGPPWYTKGGRFGLLPVMLPFLTEKCKILLDDAYRESEKRTIDQWRNFAEFDCVIRGYPFRFAEIQMKSKLANGRQSSSAGFATAELVSKTGSCFENDR